MPNAQMPGAWWSSCERASRPEKQFRVWGAGAAAAARPFRVAKALARAGTRAAFGGGRLLVLMSGS